MPQNRTSCRTGFSLLELLIVIAILGVLAGLLIPAVQKVREASNRTKCSNNLRQLGLALHGYHDSQQTFPSGVASGQPYPYLTWLSLILPYVEQQPLWQDTLQAFASDPVFDHNPPHIGFSTVIPVFNCPSDSRVLTPQRDSNGELAAFTSYQGVEGLDLRNDTGCLFLNSRINILAIKDGTSNTIIVGERPPSADFSFGWWYAGVGQQGEGSADSVLGVNEINLQNRADTLGCPSSPSAFGPGQFDQQCDMFHFWSPHPGGAQFLFADGSVLFINYNAQSIMPALASRAGGEVVSLP